MGSIRGTNRRKELCLKQYSTAWNPRKNVFESGMGQTNQRQHCPSQSSLIKLRNGKKSMGVDLMDLELCHANGSEEFFINSGEILRINRKQTLSGCPTSKIIDIHPRSRNQTHTIA